MLQENWMLFKVTDFLWSTGVLEYWSVGVLGKNKLNDNKTAAKSKDRFR